MIDEHKSLSEKFIKKGFWLYLFSFIIAPIGYIVKIIISNELTVEEVGVIYGVMSLIMLLSSFNDLGLTESLNYFLPKYIAVKDYVKAKSMLTYAMLAQIITSTIIGAFLIWGDNYLALNYFHHKESADIIFIFAFFFFGNNFFHIISTFFGSIQNTFYQKIIELIRMLFTLFLVVGVWFFDIGDIRTFSEAWIGGMYIGMLFAAFFFFKKYYFPYFKQEKALWDKELFKTLFSYAMMILLAYQAGTILSQIDMQMIIYMLGMTDAGYYTNYLSIIGIPFMIIGPIFAFLFPVFSHLHGSKDYEKITTIRQIFTKYFTVIAIICSTLFFVFGPIISYILFGTKFLESGVILQYSIFFLVFNFLLQINFNILGGTGRVKERVKIILIAIVVNMITNYLLIKWIGVAGASLATGLGWFVIYALSEKLLFKEYKITYDWNFIIKNIALSIILGTLTWIFLIPHFTGLARGISFTYLVLYTLVFAGFFAVLNKSEFGMFIGEIKKIRKR
ncbi:MAG: oligosaccharide flippase family protein [Candidatus Gracilibacteria bacterium]|nr:oligosaccharide flippase family protein [Candidatus Gracilibacteria bacterium]